MTPPEKVSGQVNRQSVSVVVPTYRHEDYVAQALESILNQTREPREVIVVNDGSPDDTDAAVRPYSDRVAYIKQRNAGIGAALNTGLAKATGEYTLFVASDDWLGPCAIEVLAGPLDDQPEVGLSYADAWITDGNGIRTSAVFPRAECRRLGTHDGATDLIAGNFLPAMSTMVRTAVARSVEGFQDYRYSQDWALWLWIAFAGWRFHGSAEKTSYYRRHEGNTSHLRHQRAMLEDSISMLLAARNIAGDTHSANIDRSIARHELWLGLQEIQEGNAAAGRSRLSDLIRKGDQLPESIAGVALSFLPAGLTTASRNVGRGWRSRKDRKPDFRSAGPNPA